MRAGKVGALLLAAALSGCGATTGLVSGRAATGERARQERPSLPASTVNQVTVSLNAGWNAVGFQASQLTSLGANSSVAGVASYADGGYQLGNFAAETVNAGAGGRRGFWVFATAATTFTYSGSGGPDFLDLAPGYNFVSFATSADVPGSSLSATVGGNPVPLGSAVLTTFYEVGPNNAYTSVDISAGGSLKAGRAYWVFAASATRLSLGGPQPSPGASPLPGPAPSVADVTFTDSEGNQMTVTAFAGLVSIITPPGTPAAELESAARSLGGTLSNKNEASGVFEATVPPGQEATLVSRLSSLPQVQLALPAIPTYLSQLAIVDNDATAPQPDAGGLQHARVVQGIAQGGPPLAGGFPNLPAGTIFNVNGIPDFPLFPHLAPALRPWVENETIRNLALNPEKGIINLSLGATSNTAERAADAEMAFLAKISALIGPSQNKIWVLAAGNGVEQRGLEGANLNRGQARDPRNPNGEHWSLDYLYSANYKGLREALDSKIILVGSSGTPAERPRIDKGLNYSTDSHGLVCYVPGREVRLYDQGGNFKKVTGTSFGAPQVSLACLEAMRTDPGKSVPTLMRELRQAPWLEIQGDLQIEQGPSIVPATVRMGFHLHAYSTASGANLLPQPDSKLTNWSLTSSVPNLSFQPVNPTPNLPVLEFRQSSTLQELQLAMALNRSTRKGFLQLRGGALLDYDMTVKDNAPVRLQATPQLFFDIELVGQELKLTNGRVLPEGQSTITLLSSSLRCTPVSP